MENEPVFYIDTNRFLPHQLKWWNLQNYIKLLVGGYGCGKTYIGALRLLYLSYLNAGLSGIYVSPTYRMAKRTIIPTLEDIALTSQLNMYRNKTDNEYIIEDWDGRFWLGSGDDPDSLRGPNLAYAGIDEPFIQDKAVFEQIIARVRHPQASHKEIFMTGTPESLNWGHDIYTNDERKYDVGTVFGKTKDNKYIPPSYYESMYNAYSPEMREAYLEGKFINLREGKAFKPFDRDRHVVSKLKDITDKNTGKHLWEICAGIDLNVDYMSCEVFANGNGKVHFFDEFRMANCTTFELADKLKEKYPGIRTFPDPTGAARKTSSTMSDHSILQQAGFWVYSRRSDSYPKDRANAINKLLIHDNMTIEPGTCPMLLRDLERVVWDQAVFNQKNDKTLTHASDGAGYALAYLYPASERKAWMADI
jgi:hypothetical protein